MHTEISFPLKRNENERTSVIKIKCDPVTACKAPCGGALSTQHRTPEPGFSLRFRHQRYYEIVVKWKQRPGYWEINEQANCRTIGSAGGINPRIDVRAKTAFWLISPVL